MIRPPKVCQVVLTRQPGGIERMICNFTAAPTMKGLDVVVCCLDEVGALGSLVEASGGRVAILKRKTGLDPGLIVRLAGFFRKQDIRAVHTHSLDPMFYAGWAAWLAAVSIRWWSCTRRFWSWPGPLCLKNKPGRRSSGPEPSCARLLSHIAYICASMFITTDFEPFYMLVGDRGRVDDCLARVRTTPGGQAEPAKLSYYRSDRNCRELCSSLCGSALLSLIYDSTAQNLPRRVES